MKVRFNLSLYLKAALVLLFCIAAAWSLRHRPGARIDPEHAKLIAVGMTVQEVAAILDDPPGDYTTLSEDMLDYARPAPSEARWANDEYSIWLTLDPDGKVVDFHHVQSWARFIRINGERPFWQRIRNWCGF